MRYTDQRKKEIEERESRATEREKRLVPLPAEKRAEVCIPVYHEWERLTRYPKVAKVRAQPERYMQQLGLSTLSELESYIERFQQPGR